jgi:hypothetical protein
MGVPLPRPAALVAWLEAPVEEWRDFDEAVLVKSLQKNQPTGQFSTAMS